MRLTSSQQLVLQARLSLKFRLVPSPNNIQVVEMGAHSMAAIVVTIVVVTFAIIITITVVAVAVSSRVLLSQPQ